MKNRSFLSATVCFVVASLACAGASTAPSTPASQPATNGANLVANPVYAAWVKFKPGTTVTLRSEYSATSSLITTQTLLEVKADKIKVETKLISTVSGTSQAPRVKVEEIAAKIETKDVERVVLGEDKPTVELSDLKSGHETLEVKGKKYDAVVYEARTKTLLAANSVLADGTQMVGSEKLWYSPEVPGGVLRKEIHLETPVKMDYITTVSEFTLSK